MSFFEQLTIPIDGAKSMELNYNDFLHARGIENKERKGAPSTRGPASSPGEPRGTKTSQHKAVK